MSLKEDERLQAILSKSFPLTLSFSYSYVPQELAGSTGVWRCMIMTNFTLLIRVQSCKKLLMQINVLNKECYGMYIHYCVIYTVLQKQPTVFLR